MDKIVLTSIREAGRHGVAQGEKDRPQPFEVDVTAELDLRGACESDNLNDTVDYAVLAATAARVVREESHDLIESVAARIADAILADGRISAVEVEVRKMRPAVEASLGHAAVRIRREQA